ncbi:MAG TPA: metallophosphoesterase [Gemmatimonadales bacterium]|nr:metallophosphoesterase [Gemmatimonadales bacterium]
MNLPLATLALALTLTGGPGPDARHGVQAPRPPGRFSFAVLGHVRGNADGLNPKLGELLARVRGLRPDFVVLTGDIIWGNLENFPTDSATIEREWDQVDSALATLGVPVYRVPGNHDINDPVSRRVYLRRYGPVPRVVETHGVRLVLLSSAYLPPDGDTASARRTRTYALDSAQVAFLRGLPPASAPSFVFMHHLLWWEEAWWREVHPLLPPAGVRAVFSGDYGPMKYSHTLRDGIRYLQTSMEGHVPVERLRSWESSRFLSAQFDNFLHVVGGDSTIRYDVRTLGEFDREFTPEWYRAIAPRWEPPTWRSRLARAIAGPDRLALVAGLGLVTFGAGTVLGVRLGRRQSARAVRGRQSSQSTTPARTNSASGDAPRSSQGR